MLLQISDDLIVNLEQAAKVERREVEGKPRVTITFHDGLTAKTLDDPGWKLWTKICTSIKPRTGAIKPKR
jgi:hypothetical protein